MHTYTWVFLLFATLCSKSVFGSYYHGPIAKPVVHKSGYLADTHDVAAAKSAHLATLAKESHYGGQSGYAGDYGHSQGEEYSGSSHGVEGHGDYRYKGYIAIPYVLHDGHIADTHEVAAAKAKHFSAVAKAKTHSGYGVYGYPGISHGHYNVPYHGPIAKPVVLKSGYLADTHEVATAKSSHLATLAKQSHYGGQHGYTSDYGYGGDHGYGHDGEKSGSHGGKEHGDYRYKGHIAIPHVLHDGHIADTHEVAAAKAEHFTAVAKAKTHSGHEYAGGYGGYSGVSHGHYNVPYHGPIAKPIVLKSGYLADTHEVASAKQKHLQTLSKANSYDHENNYH